MKTVGTCSTKGGVGKTIVSLNLAHYLSVHGNTGLCDLDLENSNFGQMVNSKEQIEITKDFKFEPYKWGEVQTFSMSLLAGRERSVSMEGSMLSRIILDALSESVWTPNLDYLVLDLPSGASDIWRSAMSLIADSHIGNILVTIPSMTDSTVKVIKLHQYFDIPILGLIENFSFFECEHGEKYDVFGYSSVGRIAKEYGVEVLGRLPLSMEVQKGVESGNPIMKGRLASPIKRAVKKIQKTEPPNPSMLAKAKERVNKIVKAGLQEVVVKLMKGMSRFDVPEMRKSTGFVEEHPIELVITDESKTKALGRYPIKVTDSGVKFLVSKSGKEIRTDFQIVTDLSTLARMIMGKKKHEDKTVPFDPLDAWTYGSLQVHGYGNLPRAVHAFRTLFEDESVMSQIRSSHGTMLSGLI